MYKIVYEFFSRILLEKFEDSHEETVLALNNVLDEFDETSDIFTLKIFQDNFLFIYEEFTKANFSIQLSSNNTFGRMESDKVIKTTINKDTKTPGGTTGNSVVF